MKAKHGFFGFAIGTLVNPMAGIAYLAVKATQPDTPKPSKGLFQTPDGKLMPVYVQELGRYLTDEEVAQMQQSDKDLIAASLPQ